jgi:RNA polymerase sigma-70 factor (ECF subfamily)
MTDEKKLVRLAAQGDQEAFGQLVSTYEKQVYNLALRMVGNREDAADLTQEAFLRVWRGLDNYKADAAFSTWLYRLTSNVCIDFLRREKRRKTVSLTFLDEEQGEAVELSIPDPAAGPEQLAIETEHRETMAAAMGELDVEFRQILTMRVINGLSYDEIGDALDLKPGTVKSRLSRAREKLRKQLLKTGNKTDGNPSKNVERGEMRENL